MYSVPRLLSVRFLLVYCLSAWVASAAEDDASDKSHVVGQGGYQTIDSDRHPDVADANPAMGGDAVLPFPPSTSLGQLRVATWNLQFLGRRRRPPQRTDDQIGLVADRIRSWDAAVVGMQEIQSNKRIKDLCEELGENWSVNPNAGWVNPQEHETALLWDRNKVKCLSHEYWKEGYRWTNRPPLAGVFQPVEGDKPFVVISVHAHPSDDRARQEQGHFLRNMVQKLTADVDGPQDIILLGDFNGRPGNSPHTTIQPESEENLLHLLPKDNGDGTTLRGGPIDHIYVTAPFLNRLPKQTSYVIRPGHYGETAEQFNLTYSDHLPVFVDFSIRTNDDSENVSHADLGPTSAAGKEWKLIWEDSFEEASLDDTKWNVIKRTRSSWAKYMSDHEDCIVIKDGKAHLRGIVNEDRPNDPAPYLTGGISTQGKFAFQYGKVEINAKLESATGAWPAMWMLADQPKYGKGSRNGEIDLMEHLNYEKQFYQTVHSYYTLELKQKENPPYFTTTPVEPGEFNVYGLQWYPDKLVFTLNGKETFVYPRLEDADPTQWPFDQPFYLMIDMQLGGSWVGEVDPDDLPVQMIVDWVRVFQQSSEGN